MKILKLLTLLLLMLCPFGCMSVKSELLAQNLEYPVSMTNSIVNSRGQHIDYKILDKFKIKHRNWFWMGGLVNLSDRQWDASEDLNNLVKENNGDAITSLQVSVSDPFLGFISPPLYLIFPGATKIILEGYVVEYLAENKDI